MIGKDRNKIAKKHWLIDWSIKRKNVIDWLRLFIVWLIDWEKKVIEWLKERRGKKKTSNKEIEFVTKIDSLTDIDRHTDRKIDI